MSAYGSRQVSQIFAADDQYQVILQVDPKYQRDPAALSMLYVQSSAGKLVPLSAVVTTSQTVGPLSVNHTGQSPSVTLSFNLLPGHGARRRRRPRAGGGARDAARDGVRELPGRGTGVPGVDGRASGGCSRSPSS